MPDSRPGVPAGADERLELPVVGHEPRRPDPGVVESLRTMSTATVSGVLHELGVSRPFIQGPQARRDRVRVAGPAVTLAFMPLREDIVPLATQEDAEKHSALWKVFDAIRPGDVLVVQAFGDRHTGCLGEMLLSALYGLGGAAAVVDGCIRDWPEVRDLDIPVWTSGFTPNFATQSGLFPWGYNTPIACGGVLVLPGDLILADDDGVVVVPRLYVDEVLVRGGERHEWEAFSRERLRSGGKLSTYYPLAPEAENEYRDWRRQQAAKR
jgi:regulator of RNase E activity RraA